MKKYKKLTTAILLITSIAYGTSAHSASLGKTAASANNARARACNQAALSSEAAAVNHTAPGSNKSPEFSAMAKTNFNVIQNCLSGLINFGFSLSGLLGKLGNLGACANSLVGVATGVDYNGTVVSGANSISNKVNNIGFSTGVSNNGLAVDTTGISGNKTTSSINFFK